MNRLSCMRFLQESLPPRDWADYPESLFEAFADHALMLRETLPRCAALEEEIFLHYVLFPRVNDEDLSFHRRIFYDALLPRVSDMSEEEAALEVNRWCCEEASYEAQDDRTASPLTVWRSGSGRCGEESAFLVSALRSVGLAARQVYVPFWAHCDDNHAWAEVLCGGRWRFLGACEPEPVLDRGWFNTAASRSALVHSRIFGRGESRLHGERIGVRDGVTYYNQTARYAAVEELHIQVVRGGAPAAGAKIVLSVLNEASLRPIAVLTADSRGEACLTLGRCDLWVWAGLDGEWTEGLRALEQNTLALDLRRPAGAAEWKEVTFRAGAAAPFPEPLSKAQKERRNADLARGKARRGAKTEKWYRGENELLRAARGNWGEIARFLNRDADPLRERLLRTLAPKDLRDCSAAALERFLAAAAPYAGRFPAALFDPYVLCPRVAFEGLALSARTAEIETVARLRARGIPARLRPLDGAPEEWRNGRFCTLEEEKTGCLTLETPDGEIPVLNRDWSISRIFLGRLQTLFPQTEWARGRCALSLPAGEYRLITTQRLPCGDQMASIKDFYLSPGGEARVFLRMRRPSLRELLYSRILPPVPARSPAGEESGDVPGTLEEPALLFWLEEGAEPTQHVLNELKALSAARRGLPLVFFLRGAEALGENTLSAFLKEESGAAVWFDDWAYHMESIARLLGVDPERPPLAVVWDGRGHAAYAESGYRVGSAALLLRLARALGER